MRRVASIFVGLVASFLLFATIGIGLSLPSQIEKDKAHYQDFQRVAALVAGYAGEHGKLPDEVTFSRLADGTSIIGPFVSPAGLNRCDGFTEADSDSFVLMSWRGDWFECFAYPSGRSTLAISAREMIVGWGSQLAMGAALSVAGFWAMLRLWRRPRSVGSAGVG